MTPKRQAEELVNQFLDKKHSGFWYALNIAKKSAMIEIDNIINDKWKNDINFRATKEFSDYWHEVKQEIYKL